MSELLDAQGEVDALNVEYRKYIDMLKQDWRSKNRVRSKNVYEVMDAIERAELDRIMAQWPFYITPLAEAWWKERGYQVLWPDDDTNPMQVQKIEACNPT